MAGAAEIEDGGATLVPNPASRNIGHLNSMVAKRLPITAFTDGAPSRENCFLLGSGEIPVSPRTRRCALRPCPNSSAAS